MESVKEFLESNNACKEGLIWAVANCKTMQDVWDTARPEWLLWLATQKGVLTESEQRKFACWCVRNVWYLLKDERSKKAVEVSELFAEGKATDKKLAAACDAAGAAAGDAAWATARAAGAAARAAAWAAGDAAWAAAGAATARAAGAAARAAACDAAGAAAGDAAWAAAWAAARDAQVKYIRENFPPNFKR